MRQIVATRGSADITMVVREVTAGNWALLRFWLSSVSSLHTLPKWMRNPDTLIQTVAAVFDPHKPRQFELRAPASVARRYNDSFEAMKAEMRGGGAARGGPASLSYRARLALLFSIRLACVVTAWHGNLAATLLISRGAYFPRKQYIY